MWFWTSLGFCALLLYTLYARTHFVDQAFDSGLLLIAAMILLALYNFKKKISFIPLGTSKSWTQIHIYVGLLSSFLFLIHISFKYPAGALEILLTILYVLTFLTGIIGLIITRFFPNRLTARGHEVVFENIPIERKNLRVQVEQLIIETANTTESKHLIDFYINNLVPYFSSPSNLIMHLVESRRPLRALIDKVNDLKRYCNQTEIESLNKINELIKSKDHLDYHNSLQGCLKLWLFVHIPLAYAMLIFAALHILMVLSFRGRIPF